MYQALKNIRNVCSNTQVYFSCIYVFKSLDIYMFHCIYSVYEWQYFKHISNHIFFETAKHAAPSFAESPKMVFFERLWRGRTMPRKLSAISRPRAKLAQKPRFLVFWERRKARRGCFVVVFRRCKGFFVNPIRSCYPFAHLRSCKVRGDMKNRRHFL